MPQAGWAEVYSIQLPCHVKKHVLCQPGSAPDKKRGPSLGQNVRVAALTISGSFFRCFWPRAHSPEASEFAGRVDHHHAVVAGVRKQLGGGKRGAALGIHGVHGGQARCRPWHPRRPWRPPAAAATSRSPGRYPCPEGWQNGRQILELQALTNKASLVPSMPWLFLVRWEDANARIRVTPTLHLRRAGDPL